MDDNNSIFIDMGIGKLPWIFTFLFTGMIFLSPFFVTIQTLRMGYNYWFNPPVRKEKAVEEDAEFVRAKPKVKQNSTEEEKKEDA